MRLSAVLSKPQNKNYVQVEGFLINNRGMTGQQVDLSVGNVMLNYFCANCDDVRTFTSQGELRCIIANKHIISIDSVLACGCGVVVQMWFIIECEDDILGHAPKVRILKRCEKLSELVRSNYTHYGNLSELLEKANRAYNECLGAGAIVYLRKIFEKITIDVANAQGIPYEKYGSGNPKNFFQLLEKVDKQYSIIPKEFSSNGYTLFRELSSVVHGEYNEELGLAKFEPLHRLVIGIIDNIKKSTEIQTAVQALGWNENGGNA